MEVADGTIPAVLEMRQVSAARSQELALALCPVIAAKIREAASNGELMCRVHIESRSVRDLVVQAFRRRGYTCNANSGWDETADVGSVMFDWAPIHV